MLANHRRIVIFDTEYTAWEGSWERRWSEPWEHREVIQIAAAVVDVAKEFMIESSCNILVKPYVNPDLSNYIIKLTGIRQQDIEDKGLTFDKALKEFYEFSLCGALPIFSWGKDELVIQENCALNKIEFLKFSSGFHDIRGVFQKAGIDTSQYNSGTVYRSVGLSFDAPQHDALNDVKSMVVTLAFLSKNKRI